MTSLLHRLFSCFALFLTSAALHAEDSPQWLTYPGGEGPGKGKKIVLIAADAAAYQISTYTHIYDAGYGSPEVDQTTPRVLKAVPAADGLSVMLQLEKISEDHIHDFDLAKIMSADGKHLVHNKAYYTVNEIPKK